MLEPPYPASEAGLDALRPGDSRRTAALDHRRADEADLLDALRAGDLLALAECWHRSAPAAHAVARRLLGAADQIETLLGDVYAELWSDPPAHGSLERWARARTFALGAGLLRARGQGPSAPSCALLLPDLPPARRQASDPVERVIVGLPDTEATALVRAHDAGVPATEQPEGDAPEALERALEALARQTLDAAPPPALDGGLWLGDLVLGLAPSAILREQLAQPDLAERVRFLRRGRRRLEGLPPAPELGPRVLLGVVARAGHMPARVVTFDGERETPMAAGVDEDVVITVARQAPGDASGAASAVAAHEDTGPIAVIAPELAEPEDFPVWPGDPDPSSSWPAALEEPETHADPAAPPSVRRGVGLLLIGTALGMLAGALALVLR